MVDLVAKIPEEKVRELLVGFVLADESLKNELQLQYEFKMNSKLMLELRTEVEQIVYQNSTRGYADWYHASEFRSGLSGFLDTKVKLLIEKNCLRQAFELTNLVFHYIGTIDMDDSDGGSSYVAENCYKCWKEIIEKSDDKFKNEMKVWFETPRDEFVVDYLEEYIDEILIDAFATEEELTREIEKLDIIIDRHMGTDCGKIYSILYGFENPVIKRIEYMKKLHCTEAQIDEYRQANRRFFVIREMEISEAIERNDYETAIKVLLESRQLDKVNREQLKKYNEQLITAYQKTGAVEEYRKELKHYLVNYWQYDLTYVKMLKSSISDLQEWNQIVDDIAKKNRDEDFVCKLLHGEKRYEQLMNKIENSYSKVRLLDEYERILCKQMPDRVIKIYSEYLDDAAESANERKKYKALMPYLKKISKCSGGKEVAKEIVDTWRRKYKRRSAMMEEMRNAGF